ncbi:catalase-like protein isoform X2 [Tanacetum coccineum]
MTFCVSKWLRGRNYWCIPLWSSSVNSFSGGDTLSPKKCKTHYVKFTWKPTCGVKCLLEEEACKVGGANHSHATQDLYDSISAGNFPEWKLFLQVIDPDHEDRLDFDPLDGTMTWPKDVIPLQPVGRMVLNKNIDNFFAENEQLAFNPGLVVPGIYYSDDKMLQGRIFAYSDTQRHRLGPNYLQLPVNAPKCAHHNNHFDGSMNFMHRDEEVDYFPVDSLHRVQNMLHSTLSSPARVTGTDKDSSAVIPKYNDFKQPGERYRSWAPDRQERFISRNVKMLSDPRVTHELRSIWISYWSQEEGALYTSNTSLYCQLYVYTVKREISIRRTVVTRVNTASLIFEEWSPDLDNGQYDIVDQVMRPLALVQERKVRKDTDIKKGRRSTSSSSAFHHGSSSHQFDDDKEIQDEGTSRNSTLSPRTYYNSISPIRPQVFKDPEPHEQNMPLYFLEKRLSLTVKKECMWSNGVR